MKFSAPRSCSPSPVRGKARHSAAFGLHSDSDSEEYDSELDSPFDSEDDSISIAESSSSSSEISLVADVNRLSLRPRHISRSPLEERNIEETVAAIRLRTRYHDPYEEWEKQTRKDAFKTARREFTTKQTRLQEEQQRLRAEEEQRVAAKHVQQATIIQQKLDEFALKMQQGEDQLRAGWKERDRQLWERIEAVIKMEEAKVAEKMEAERKAKEEEDRKRKEAELKKRLEDEKRLKEELDKQKAEDEKKRLAEEKVKAEQEAEEKRQKQEEAKQRRAGEELELRKMLSFNTADEEWRVARENLKSLKTGPIHHVKSHKDYKTEWGRLRRQMVPKIGQLTNDPAVISRITSQLLEILQPPSGPLDSTLYIALCYSLAKAILLQAETEVTAEKRSAIPLAKVTFSLLESLEHFPSIFFSKLVQRCGGWPIPFYITNRDHQGQPWADDAERIKTSGYRKSVSGEGLESAEEHSNRISGIMRVYFHILKIRPLKQPMDMMFQLPRCWTWLARVTGDVKLLQHYVAPQLIYTVLDVMGIEAKAIWGQQWIKMIALIYEGITTGYEPGKLIGGNSPEGGAARTRALLAIERIMKDTSRPEPPALFS